MSKSSSFICLAAQLLLLLATHVKAQFCTNTCPPLNDLGIPQESLCIGSDASSYASKVYSVCHPFEPIAPTFSLEDYRGYAAIVIANFYVGCNAGRRESGVFAHVAQRYYNEYPNDVMFVSSLKGGASCGTWAFMYQRDAQSLYPESDVVPTEMPLTVDDTNYDLRDDYFTTPFGHPSYVVLNGNLTIVDKFVGPCCGFETMAECTRDIARSLDVMLAQSIDPLLASAAVSPTPAPIATTPSQASVPPSPAPLSPTQPPTNTPPTPSITACMMTAFTNWSPCSLTCGDGNVNGTQFRWRNVTGGEPGVDCPEVVEVRTCTPTNPCPSACIAEFGSTYNIEPVVTGFDSPRDVAFSPTPGLHLGSYSEGRSFDPSVGEEAWVVNGANHSISIVASLGSTQQTTISRRDRGYYHYLINVTALSFNMVSNSGRDADKDTFSYFSVCNDNLNTYLDAKEPNYFMGPTLYNSDPSGGNTVNRLGGECRPSEPCFFLHADMLHESPACIGIVHDPETVTAFGTVYWVFDSTGNRENGQLVRFDFQQPHGPRSMDHSVAAVRRYPDIKLERGPPGVHAGMVVHDARRELFVASPGAGTVLAVGADSGRYARTAREEYPIFSNRLPSFEYSIYECAEERVFASGLDTPSGLALSPDGKSLFVAEHFTGKIHVYEIESGSLLETIQTNFSSIGGMMFSPETEVLHFVDADTNTLAAVKPLQNCSSTWQSRLSPEFTAEVASAEAALGNAFSMTDERSCVVNPVIPNATLFEQVHSDSGYASNDTSVQGPAGMNPTAVLLANRTDCGYDSELNFDALLLGGYFCHTCLPITDGAMCDDGGQCSNVQWDGYLCDNEFVVKSDSTSGNLMLETTEGTPVNPVVVVLKRGVTYRFTIEGDTTVSVNMNDVAGAPPLPLPGNACGCASNGPLLVTIDESFAGVTQLFLKSEVSNSAAVPLAVESSSDTGNGEYTIAPSQGPASSTVETAVLATSTSGSRPMIFVTVVTGVVSLTLSLLVTI